MRVEIKMPYLGPDMERGKIVRWLKAVGDLVERGEGIAEIEGEKVTVEMEARAGGRLIEFLHGPGDEVPVGATIGWIETLE